MLRSSYASNNQDTAQRYDVIVVGGGHAGCEAALAAARLGCETLLVTGSIERIAAMSCNPAIGGVGKGHLVKELDVLGGEMARVADMSGIHFRTLNESRGPAVRATRCQSDMDRYKTAMGKVVVQQERLRIRQDDVVEVLVDDNGAACGVAITHGEKLFAHCVIITTGTFMGGVLHKGIQRTPGGRAGESPANGLSFSLAALGLRIGRLKTGTCPRLDSRTIRMDKLEQQMPDNPAPRFSVMHGGPPPLPQINCALTRTTTQTHQVIVDAVNAGDSPLFNGQIGGKGPRYCPSIEDKVIRFQEKESHQIFLEPHGLDTFELYPNGLSTSLPPSWQLRFLRTIPGLEEVEITRYGYAVEYDYVDPTQLHSWLECKNIPGLWCAGQINGTTGYEEAAIQGLWAGIHAARRVQGKTPIVLHRDQAYAGVMFDDLTLLGTEEPYRMFTSRAEYRLVLREDNVGYRLGLLAEEIGLSSAAQQARIRSYEHDVQQEIEALQGIKIEPRGETQTILQNAGMAPLKQPQSAADLLRRPDMTYALAYALSNREMPASDELRYRVLTEIRYAPFIARAQEEVERERALNDETIPQELFAQQLPGISNEVYEKLKHFQPKTLGQASRISGVTPAAVGLLAIEMRKLSRMSKPVQTMHHQEAQ